MEQQGLPTQPQSTSNKPLIFGVLAVVLLFIPPVALIFGILALVFAAKAHKAAKARGETAPRAVVPTVLGAIGIAASSILMIIAAVGFVSALVPIISSINSSSSANADYPERIEAFEAAKKNFTVDETVEFGPYDLAVRDIQRTYIPSSQEAAIINEAVADARTDKYDKKHNTYGQNTASEDMVYTKFIVDLSHNAERAEVYKKITMSMPSWGAALTELKLDGNECIWRSVDEGDELRNYDNQYREESLKPVSVTYICIGETATPTEVELEVSAFSRVSSIVGTEGMPRKQFIYTIQF